MGTITSLSVIVKAQKVLQDATGIRWDNAELLGWLNSAQREIVLYKPNANATGKAVKLAAGTRQALPTDGVQLIDVVRNMGTSGTTPGRAVRQIERETLDAVNPDWHASSASATAKHFIYNILDPKAFYVYPPQPATNQGYVETSNVNVAEELVTMIQTQRAYELNSKVVSTSDAMLGRLTQL